MKTYLLAVGVDQADQRYYQNTFSELQCCKNDVDAFVNCIQSKFRITKSPSIFKDTSAKAAYVLDSLDYYSDLMDSGDLLIIYYSGHGSQVEDTGFEEEDSYDETLCLFDRMLIDDELFFSFSKFREGTKILMISDSCHSGTVTRALGLETATRAIERDNYAFIKKLDPVKAQGLFLLNADKHKDLQRIPVLHPDDIKTSVLLFSACQDKEFALGGEEHSLFTKALLEVLEEGAQDDDMSAIFQRVQALTEARSEQHNNDQVPNMYTYGQDPESIKKMTIRDLIVGDYAVDMVAFGWQQRLLIDLIGAGEDVRLIDIEKRTRKMVEVLENTYQIVAYERLDDTLRIRIKSTFSSAWDAAYDVYFYLRSLGRAHFVQPEHVNTQDKKLTPRIKGKKPEQDAFLENWPKPDENLFDWYLKDRFSQLERARNHVLEKVGKNHRKIRIAHIDTGYVPAHPSTPEFVLEDLGRSFKSKEENNKGLEVVGNKLLIEMDYHGMGTVAILAAPDLSDKDVTTYGGFSGVMGAIPFAEILPLRIGDTVMLLGAQIKAFKAAVEYAIESGCAVITMSMAGAPSRLMAKAVNKAYEAGVVIVSAAGNNSNYFADVIVPESVLYPARYARVIAATGAAYNKVPYDFIAQKKLKGGKLGEHMQGNWGPPSAMKTAIAAYTPNVPWASLYEKEDGTGYAFSRAGGGTSAATPQIAAAAALWLLYHRDRLEEEKFAGWQKVEAVKYALFSSADRRSYEKSEKYYGNGLLKAYDALHIFPSKNILEKAPEASESWFQLHRTLNVYNPFAKGAEGQRKEMDDPLYAQMLAMEIEELLMQEYGREDFETLSDAHISYLKNHPRSSEKLRNSL